MHVIIMIAHTIFLDVRFSYTLKKQYFFMVLAQEESHILFIVSLAKSVKDVCCNILNLASY